MAVNGYRKAGAALVGMFATSLAGHDKGRMYFIIKEEGDFVYLVDGKSRGTQNPKKKRKKHLQAIRAGNEALARKLKDGETIYNEEIRFAIKIWNQSHNLSD